MTSLYDHGAEKFPDAGLLASSLGRGWGGLAAELRTHPACDIPDICSRQTEITFAVRGTGGGMVERRGNGRFQATPSRSGALWLCPKGVNEDQIRLTEAIPEVLHVYIPDDQIDALSGLASRPVAFDENIYRAGLEDEFVRQICVRILGELTEETAGGSLLMEHLASVLVTHISGSYTDHCIEKRGGGIVGALDQRRLKRVQDYIEDNLETDLTVAEIASVACLSRYHFARAFRTAVGESPNSYIGSRRINRALSLLSSSEMSLVEIAFVCRFSSQAAFAKPSDDSWAKRRASTDGVGEFY
uniref:helix-turn-helix domain-containing protein n=1 Tax=uncultured Rhizobium sp. TaxID=155567 RepID=UPI0026317995|nr:AraC family transcriptional regulator [uncultured Rhizobium sp.]